MRSRLLLLVALARTPSLLILDEPTTGLDPAAVDETLGELVASASDGTTVLLVTHRLDEVERICDEIVVMHEGRSVLHGNLDDLRASWRVVEVAGHPAPERLETWEEVTRVTAFGEHARLVVHTAPERVVERVRMLGAEVTSVRPLTLREIYFAALRTEDPDAGRNDLA
jgi:ABC-2 type transport system ATP-binding protein